MDDMEQINTEIHLADIRTALVFVWAIMLLVAARFIDSLLVSSLLVIGSICLAVPLLLERIILRD